MATESCRRFRGLCVCQSLAHGANSVREVNPAKENMACQSNATERGLTEEAGAHTAVGVSNTPFHLLHWYDLSLGVSFSGCSTCCRHNVLEAFTDTPWGISSLLVHSPRAPLFSVLRGLQDLVSYFDCRCRLRKTNYFQIVFLVFCQRVQILSLFCLSCLVLLKNFPLLK